MMTNAYLPKKFNIQFRNAVTSNISCVAVSKYIDMHKKSGMLKLSRPVIHFLKEITSVHIYICRHLDTKVIHSASRNGYEK